MSFILEWRACKIYGQFSFFVQQVWSIQSILPASLHLIFLHFLLCSARLPLIGLHRSWTASLTQMLWPRVSSDVSGCPSESFCCSACNDNNKHTSKQQERGRDSGEACSQRERERWFGLVCCGWGLIRACIYGHATENHLFALNSYNTNITAKVFLNKV